MTLRRATAADSKTVFNLRNLPDSIRYSGSGEAITWPDHQKWFEYVLKSEDTLLWIIEPNVGSVRLDKIEEEAIISIYLWPSERGRGVGPIAINTVVREAFETWQIKKIIAYVNNDNLPSLRAFEKCGFFEATINIEDCPTGFRKLVTV